MNRGEQLPKLKPQIGEKHVIALSQPYGKPVRSNFGGDQLMFTLVDGRKMFLDPYVQDRIKALGVSPGVPFELEMVEILHGNRRTAEIVVRPVPASAPYTPAAPAQQINVQRESIQHTAPAPQPPATIPPAPVNGAGETHAVIMQRCYCAAVDVALAAIACAEKKGLRLTAQFEDIRAMGTALLIAETGRR